MTETSESMMTDHGVVDQALSVIDQELLRLAARDMVTASDVTDMLLDLRLLLAPGNEESPAPLPA